MATATAIRAVDRANPDVVAALEAEQRLFDYYGLDVKTHDVALASGLRVRVMESGSGPPLMLVPGGVGDGWIWAPLIAELNGYRLIVVNRPGGGLSDGVDHTQVDLRQLAVETLTAVVDYFQLEQMPVVCSSMGGLWSIWFALEQPERVQALLQFGCPALALNTSAPLPMRLMSVPLLNRLLVKAMIPGELEKARKMPEFLGHPETVGDNWPEPMAACSYHFPRLPTYERAWLSLMESVLTVSGPAPRYACDADQLRQLQQPVLYVWGDNDPFGSVEVAREAVSITPNAELREVPGGHLPWWDHPAACAHLVRAFLG